MPTQCEVCLRKFNRKKDMLEHAKIHKANKVYTCKTCKEQFLKLEDHDHHIKRHRPKTPVCHICQKQCIDYYKLARHLRTHTGDKPFVCSICEKSFADKFNFERHELIHKSNKPFVCSICDRGYPSLENLQKHLQSHDDEGNDCEICGKSFPDKSKLNRHLLTHSNEKPEVCDICHKAFKQSSTLKRHLLTHMDGKEYSCDICNVAFTTKNQLYQHNFIHKVKNDHICDYCDKSFPLERQLRTHVKVAHAEHLSRRRAILPNVMLERVELVTVNNAKNSTQSMDPVSKLGTSLTDDFADAFLVPVEEMNLDVNQECEVPTYEINVECEVPTYEINVECEVPTYEMNVEYSDTHLPVEQLSSSLNKTSYVMADSEIADALNFSNIPMDNSSVFKQFGFMNDLEDILVIPQENDFPINDSAEIVEPP